MRSLNKLRIENILKKKRFHLENKVIKNLKNQSISSAFSFLYETRLFIKMNIFGSESLASMKRTKKWELVSLDSHERYINLPLNSQKIILYFDRYFVGTSIESDTYVALVDNLELSRRNYILKNRKSLLDEKIHIMPYDHLIFDGNHLEVNEIDFLRTMKIRMKIKVTVIAQDSWNNEHLIKLREWNKVADAIVYFDKGSDIEKIVDQHKLSLKLPPRKMPVNLPFRQSKFLTLGFSGSFGPARLEWIRKLIAITKKYDNLKLEYNLFSKKEPNILSNFDSYMCWFKQLDVVVNFTYKKKRTYILNGRAVDALSNGKILLHQVGEIDYLSAFFIPGQHYFPFRTTHELAKIIESISKMNRESILEMGDEVRRFYVNHYSKAYINQVF